MKGFLDIYVYKIKNKNYYKFLIYVKFTTLILYVIRLILHQGLENVLEYKRFFNCFFNKDNKINIKKNLCTVL